MTGLIVKEFQQKKCDGSAVNVFDKRLTAVNIREAM
jgi:hypothetical protein